MKTMTRQDLLRQRQELTSRLSAVEELLAEEHGWPYPDGATCLRKCSADTRDSRCSGGKR